ncbi:PIN domain-containing protein [Synechocystis salina LEGE 06099]|uniref:type II toxin-antitoxin system VapC family toxin n=1 Tax=Synechocystis salina TaxID=945780 RepID=UPI00187E2C42|nr:PIN domain-containing protein [Synechocystis salina]MBE9202865.1 PIN domain-containing protein [Synechocystis salina LEGE 06099]
MDANLLIAAWRNKDDLGMRALDILDDPQRIIVLSRAVWLEVMPKAIYHKQVTEMTFYQKVFDIAEVREWSVEAFYKAENLAQQYGIAAMDAVHLAIAITANVDEFVSAEKPKKPMFRISEIVVRSIRGNQ